MTSTAAISHRTVDVDGLEIFYREQGPADGPAVLLLHGFPTASHQFRGLMPLLPPHFRVVAPDYPGFGYSESPESSTVGGPFVYSFDRLSKVMERFCEIVGLRKFALYVFDYGAPVGFRIAERRPDWISALVVQNANAYEEGLSDMARGLIALRRGVPEDAAKIMDVLSPEAIRAQYLTGAGDPASIAPDGWTLDSAFLALPGRKQIQVDLALDYGSNVQRYAAWQEWLSSSRPRTLILWGRNDPFFLEAGAHAYLRHLADAELHLYETGHFALEEKLPEIAPVTAAFLDASIR